MRFTPRLAVVLTIVILAAVNVRVPHAALVVGPTCAALLLWLTRRRFIRCRFIRCRFIRRG